jgi:hypothetical protein
MQHQIFCKFLWELRANFVALNDEHNFIKTLHEVFSKQIQGVLQTHFSYETLFPLFAFVSMLLLNNFIQLDQFLAEVIIPLLQELEPKDVKVTQSLK